MFIKKSKYNNLLKKYKYLEKLYRSLNIECLKVSCFNTILSHEILYLKIINEELVQKTVDEMILNFKEQIPGQKKF